MNQRSIVLTFSLAAIACLPAIAQLQPNTMLPSGRKVHINKVGPVVYAQGSKDKTIMLTFASDFQLDDKVNLAKEVREIWALLRMQADQGGYDSAVVSAQRSEGVVFQTGKSFNFVFKKDGPGRWSSMGDQDLTKDAQLYFDLLPLLQKKQHAQAVKLLGELIKLWPQSAQCYINRAACLISMNSLNLALADLDTAINLEPQISLAYNNRGIVHRKLGNNAKAFADWDKAIDLDPKSDMAYMNRAALNVRLNKADKALGDLNKAIELNPNLAEAYWWRGKAYGILHNGKESKADLDTASKRGFREGTDTWDLKIVK